MRPCHFTATLAPCLVLATTLSGIADVGYSPDASARDEQSWTVEHTLELADISLDVSSGESGDVPEIEMSTTRTRSLTIAQVHVEASEGAPSVLERRFSDVEERLEGSLVIESDGLDETVDASIDTPLEGVSVRFRWSATDDAWARKLIDDEGEEVEGDEDLIDGLAVDAHLGGLMVGLKEAKEGATWEAEPGALLALVAPGGHLGADIDCTPDESRGFEPVAAGLDPLLGMDLHYLLGGATDGEIACRLEELTDQTAVIAIRVEVTATRDVIDRVEPWVESIADMLPVEISRADAEVTFSGEGKVTWDVATGLPAAVSLELSIDYTLERDADIVMPDGLETVLSTTVTLEGSLSSEMTTD